MTTSHHYMMFFTNTGHVIQNESIRNLERAEPQEALAIINLLRLQLGRENYRSDPNQGIYRRTLSVYGN